MTSFRARCLNGLMKLTLRPRIRPGLSLDKMRLQSARADRRIGGKIGDCIATDIEGAPVPTKRITAPNSREDRVILYFHGGGFCMHMPNTYKRHAARISEQTGAVVYLVDYRLTPEHAIHTCFEDAFESYRWLLDQGTPPANIIIAGDSYGQGSSREHAALCPMYLGVRAVIAESYERIHRSNLIGMGVLPLQFLAGESASSLGLTGKEAFSVTGLA